MLARVPTAAGGVGNVTTGMSHSTRNEKDKVKTSLSCRGAVVDMDSALGAEEAVLTGRLRCGAELPVPAAPVPSLEKAVICRERWVDLVQFR